MDETTNAVRRSQPTENDVYPLDMEKILERARRKELGRRVGVSAIAVVALIAGVTVGLDSLSWRTGPLTLDVAQVPPGNTSDGISEGHVEASESSSGSSKPSNHDDESPTVDVALVRDAPAQEGERELQVGDVPGGHGTLTVERFDLIPDGRSENAPFSPPSVSLFIADDPSVLPTIASTRADYDRIGADTESTAFDTEAGEWQALHVPLTGTSIAGLQVTDQAVIRIVAPNTDLNEVRRLASFLRITTSN